jgi:hypothetical protein
MKHAHLVVFTLFCFTMFTKAVAFLICTGLAFLSGILWLRFSLLGVLCTTCTGV